MILKRSLKQDLLLLAVFTLACAGMYFLPDPPALAKQTGLKEPCMILETDDSQIEQHGLLEFGSQMLKIKVLSGPCKGKTYKAVNELRAQMELDKKFKPGDRALVIIQNQEQSDDNVLTVQDYERSGWLLFLSLLFCGGLCLFGGWVGVKALFSFVFSCIAIWKAVIPLTLNGWNASWTSFGCVVVLTAMIQFLVAGVNRKGTVAFAGAITGILAGLGMAHLFTVVMKINGAVLPYSQILYYSGGGSLNLQDLFIGAMILACSGAVMDLAMDISAGVCEIARHSPDLPAKELIRSGLRIGQSVVGTMTTTLLLAYSGGYITLLMMFSTQGSSLIEIVNNPLVASEAVKTLVGSFSLILVAPFSALFAGWLFRPKKKL